LHPSRNLCVDGLGELVCVFWGDGPVSDRLDCVGYRIDIPEPVLHIPFVHAKKYKNESLTQHVEKSIKLNNNSDDGEMAEIHILFSPPCLNREHVCASA
jgi:hypothetical protein